MLCLGTHKVNSYGQHLSRTSGFWLGETALVFHIVCIFAVRSGPMDFFCSVTGAEESMCEQVEPRGWKWLRWSEVRWNRCDWVAV